MKPRHYKTLRGKHRKKTLWHKSQQDLFFLNDIHNKTALKPFIVFPRPPGTTLTHGILKIIVKLYQVNIIVYANTQNIQF